MRAAPVIRPLIGALVALIRTAGMEPVLYGGEAMKAWGAADATADIDFLVAGRRLRLALLQRVVESAGGHWGPQLAGGGPPTQREARFRYQGARVDVVHARDWRLRAVVSRAALFRCLGPEVRVARLEDLVMTALNFGRAKDIERARRVVARHRGQLDHELLEIASREWGVEEHLDAVGVIRIGGHLPYEAHDVQTDVRDRRTVPGATSPMSSRRCSCAMAQTPSPTRPSPARSSSA